jgi:hypothetical protein
MLKKKGLYYLTQHITQHDIYTLIIKEQIYDTFNHYNNRKNKSQNKTS